MFLNIREDVLDQGIKHKEENVKDYFLFNFSDRMLLDSLESVFD